ncbi:MAG: CotH kinase family protein [Acutalibacteraceae bacterium]
MKASKKIISIFLSFIIVLSFGAILASAEGSLSDFSVTVFDDKECSISWWKSELDGKYYIFLPSDCDLSSLEVSFKGVDTITIDGKTLESGSKTDIFAKGGEYQLNAAGEKYSVVFFKSENLPSIYIQTESGSLDAVHADKNYKEKAEITVAESGKVTISADLDYIKGRGNSTWRYDKKPYNIKFSKKTDLFSMGKAKKWSLIASADEQSLIRNKSVYDLAEDAGLLYSSKSQHVDLYINGEYRGNYLVCESVEIGSSRIDITDLEDATQEANAGMDIESFEQVGSKDKQSGYVADTIKYVEIPNDPADISGGYLLEFEQFNRYYKEVSGFTTKLGQPVIFKSPEYASKAQAEYIKAYYQEFEDAVYSKDGKNEQGKYYADYIDMTMMARMYIIQELVMNLDASTTSFYLFKDAGSDKFVASPVWDFDYSLGKKAKRNGIDLTDPTVWYVKSHYLYDDRGFLEKENVSFPTLLTQLCTHDDFMQLVKSEWKNSFEPVLGKSRTKTMTELYRSLESSAVMDAIRWNRYETTDVDENLKQFQSEAQSVVTFLEKRTAALEKGFSDDNATLIYDANGGYGCTYNSQIVSVGESATVRGCNFDSQGFRYFFRGWNTEPDGSGTSYAAGDEIKITDTKITLYAQWEQVSVFRATAARTLELFIQVLYAMLSSFFSSVC